MTDISVSVIIPCHNAEKTLSETVASVLQQSGVRFEVIAVNDHSSDGTAALLQSFGNQLRVVDAPRKGAGAARNAGLSLAGGNYLQFLDADDLLLPGTLAQRVRAMEDQRADVVYCDWAMLDEQPDGRFAVGRSIARSMEQVHPRPEIATLTDFWAPLASLLYRRPVVERLGGFREDLRVIEDARLLQDAAWSKALFLHLPGIGAHYRVPLHRDTRSRRDPALFALDCLENALQIEARWRQGGAPDGEQARALAKVYGQCANALLRHNRRDAFFRALGALYTVEPGLRISRPKIAGLLWRTLPHPAVSALVQMLSRVGQRLGHRPP